MIVCKKGFDIKKVYEAANVNELFCMAEQMATEYLKTLQIDGKIYKQQESKKHKNIPCSYYIIAKIDVYSVYHKYKIPGYIYNTYKVNKLASFKIIRTEKKRFINTLQQDPHMYTKNELFADIHSDIHKILDNSLPKNKEYSISSSSK